MAAGRDYGTRGKTTGAPGEAAVRSLRKSAGVASQDFAFMKDRAKTFTMTHLRCENEMIVEVKGRSGFWPMRRPVRYRLGGNCDSITVSEGHLVVHRDGTLLASADLQHPGALRWGWLLFPRHMREQLPPWPPRD